MTAESFTQILICKFCFFYQQSTRREPWWRVRATPVLRDPPVLPATPAIRVHSWTKVPPWSGLVDSTCSNRAWTEGFWGIPLANYNNCHLLPLRAQTNALETLTQAAIRTYSDKWYGPIARSPKDYGLYWWVGLHGTKHQRHGQQVLMSLATIIEMDQSNITKEMES